MTRIFLSFRKIDDRAGRERIYEALKGRYGAEQVFKSGESIPAGIDYVQVLLTQAAACEVMVVLIGPGWVDATGREGLWALGREQDWVRREIATALASGNRVVPVLVGDGTMLPTAAQLPDDIAAMATLQALRVEDSAFETGLARLIAALDRQLPGLAKIGPPDSGPPDAGPPDAGPRQSAEVHGGVSIIGGRDVKTGGAPIVGGDYDQKITNKKGGNAAGFAVLVATLLGYRPVAKAAAWTRLHPAIAGVSVVVVFGAAAGGIIVGVSGGGTAAAAQHAPLVATARPVVGGVKRSPLPTAAPTPTVAAAPVQGASIASFQAAGSPVDAWADGHVLAVETWQAAGSGDALPSAAPLRVITAYSLPSGQQIGDYTPDVLQQTAGCADQLVRSDSGTDILLTEYTKVVPAQGLTPGSDTIEVEALNADTGSTLWTDAIPDYTDATGGEPPNPDWCSRESVGGSQSFLMPTSDGRYVLDTEIGPSSYVIDLDSGALTEAPNATGVLGKWIAEPSGLDANGENTAIKLFDPGTGALAGTITNSEAVYLVPQVGHGYADTQVTSNGLAVFGTGGNDDSYNSAAVMAVSLPSGTVAWTDPSPSGGHWADTVLVDPDTGGGVGYAETEDPGNPEMAGFSSTTGKVLWTLPAENFCGVTNGRVYVIANYQLAVLDETTGAQITYDPSVSKCPSILDGVVEEPSTEDAGLGNASTVTFTVG